MAIAPPEGRRRQALAGRRQLACDPLPGRVWLPAERAFLGRSGLPVSRAAPIFGPDDAPPRGRASWCHAQGAGRGSGCRENGQAGQCLPRGHGFGRRGPGRPRRIALHAKAAGPGHARRD